MTFETAATLAGIQDAASIIEIRAPGDQVEAVRAALAKQFPAADVRTIVAVAGTESNVVLKIRASLFLLTLIILAITTLCVTSNFSEMVIERSKEIGILKALARLSAGSPRFSSPNPRLSRWPQPSPDTPPAYSRRRPSAVKCSAECFASRPAGSSSPESRELC